MFSHLAAFSLLEPINPTYFQQFIPRCIFISLLLLGNPTEYMTYHYWTTFQSEN